MVERIQFAKWHMLKITLSILSREEGVSTLGPQELHCLHPSALSPEILQALFCPELFQMWLIFLLMLL